MATTTVWSNRNAHPGTYSFGPVSLPGTGPVLVELDIPQGQNGGPISLDVQVQVGGAWSDYARFQWDRISAGTASAAAVLCLPAEATAAQGSATIGGTHAVTSTLTVTV